MFRGGQRCAGVLVMLLAGYTHSFAADVNTVFSNSRDDDTRGRWESYLGAECILEEPVGPLTIQEVVKRAICVNPKAKQSWAVIKGKAAAIRLSEAAYLPQVQTILSYGFDRSSAASPGNPLFDSNVSYTNPKAELDVSFSVFDFGLRAASVRATRQSLISAYALRDDVLKAVVLQAAQGFYDLLRATAVVTIDKEMEENALDIRQVADGRYRGGAAPLSEKLQSEATCADLALKRIGDEGTREIAKGGLGSIMGLAPYISFEIFNEPIETPELPDIAPIQELVQQAINRDPKVNAATADASASAEELHAARVADLPTLSVQSVSTRGGQKYAPNSLYSAYQNNANFTSRSNEVELEVTVPISNWATRGQRIRSSEADVMQKENVLEATKQDVAVGVWRAYQTLKVSIKTLEASRHIREIADELYLVSKGRYETGGGSLTELLNAERELNMARIRATGAMFDLQFAYLDLLSSIGTLSVENVRAINSP
jgi:outer membrane protein